ncbi:MAG: peptidoglycan-binding protein [Oscillospiraceae bacterium]|nr:peptidoglycan-binding protein [Oscillospiraceae bacterium]
MKNDTVEALQTLLSGHTGYALGVDGSFGPATEETLRAFQRDNALQVDGSCGPATWAALLGVGA